VSAGKTGVITLETVHPGSLSHVVNDAAVRAKAYGLLEKLAATG